MSAPGLYLHIPFCSAICPYCDFAVLRGGGERRARFVDALIAELLLWRGAVAAGVFGSDAFDSVYFGGGTPSLLAPEQLAAIFEAVRRSLPIAPDVWISMEVNPEDVTAEALAAWRASGVHTVTLGVQSFRDEALRFLGRRHDGAAARRAVADALATGFDVVGVDLIYGLPGQTAAEWQHDLDEAAALGAPHLSCYQLTVHAGTPFGRRAERGILRELSEGAQAELFLLTHARLSAAGYTAYEVSNFALHDEQRSRHNRKYWSHAPYLGVGPSAHSFDGRRRWWNHRQLGRWEEAVAGGCVPHDGREELGAEALALEHLMLGLRTRDGVDLGRLRALGCDLLASNGPLLARLEGEGLLRVRDDRLLPTLAGWAVADGLAGAFALVPSPGRRAAPG
jgi:oxygen-independent coproporphyrinogen-3 oxidase